VTIGGGVAGGGGAVIGGGGGAVGQIQWSPIVKYELLAGKRALRAFNGMWVVAEGDHLETRQHLHEHLGHATFVIETIGGALVTLRTHHGKYVCADMHNVHLSDKPTIESQFHLEWHEGSVSFRSHIMGYLGVRDDGHIHVVRGHQPNTHFEFAGW